MRKSVEMAPLRLTSYEKTGVTREKVTEEEVDTTSCLISDVSVFDFWTHRCYNASELTFLFHLKGKFIVDFLNNSKAIK